jgi:hypothetical protein
MTAAADRIAWLIATGCARARDTYDAIRPRPPSWPQQRRAARGPVRVLAARSSWQSDLLVRHPPTQLVEAMSLLEHQQILVETRFKLAEF